MMQIQVRTDKQIPATQDFIEQVQTHLEEKLQRFETRITRLEVHFTDENSSAKQGDDDKRCQIEARLNGLKPISVTAHTPQIFRSLTEATQKLRDALDSTLGRLEDRR